MVYQHGKKFAHVEFDSPVDCKEALRAKKGARLRGQRLRLDLADNGSGSKGKGKGQGKGDDTGKAKGGGSGGTAPMQDNLVAPVQAPVPHEDYGSSQHYTEFSGAALGGSKPDLPLAHAGACSARAWGEARACCDRVSTVQGRTT